jgi:hypothetical protein
LYEIQPAWLDQLAETKALLDVGGDNSEGLACALAFLFGGGEFQKNDLADAGLAFENLLQGNRTVG